MQRCRLFPLLLAASGCLSNEHPQVELHAKWIPAVIEGDVKITEGGVPGTATRLNMEDDLDLDPDDQGDLGVLLDFDSFRLGISALPFHFEGEERFDGPETFRGTLFSAGDRVASELDLDTWTVRLEMPIVEGGDTTVRLGAAAYWWDLELRMADLDTGVRERRSFSRLLPAVTLDYEASLNPRWSIRLDGAFATLDEGRHLFDTEALVVYAFSGFPGRVVAGYRYLQYDLNEDTNIGTLRVHGPTLGVEFRF